MRALHLTLPWVGWTTLSRKRDPKTQQRIVKKHLTQPSLNAWRVWHPLQRKTHVERVYKMIADAAEAAGWPKGEAPMQHALVVVTYHFPMKRTRDKDDWGPKFLLDGLTMAGIIAADDWDHCDPDWFAEIDRENPRIELLIVEVHDLKNRQRPAQVIA